MMMMLDEDDDAKDDGLPLAAIILKAKSLFTKFNLPWLKGHKYGTHSDKRIRKQKPVEQTR